MNVIGKIKRVSKKSIGILLGHGKINKNNKGVINLIDVGSASGNLPSPWFDKSQYVKKMLCFDPQEEDVFEKDIITVGQGLWKEEAVVPIYFGSHACGASLFKQNTEFVDGNFEQLQKKGPPILANSWYERSKTVEQKEVNVTTLDKVITGLDIDFSFDFLKIDAQGAEYEILVGSEEFLKEECIGLHLELFNVPLYKNIKLEPEVTAYLKELGFSLLKKFPFHGTFDSQNDCVYLKLDTVKKEKLDIIKQIYNIK